MALSRRRFLPASGGIAGGVLATSAPATAGDVSHQAWETVIGGGTFNSYSALEAAWHYRYPWGSDHNGTARMYASPTDHNHVYIATPGTLTIKATRISGATSWPPESDILEYKGDNRNWFNTYKNASGGWSNTIVRVSNPGAWHGYRAWITKVNATDVDIHCYLDGRWVGQHRGANFVGKPMWIIINLQMEGSSGSPGPAGDTYYRARNIYVGRTNNG